jgi:asparagine synthase (glutamine-hydrolysing)
MSGLSVRPTVDRTIDPNHAVEQLSRHLQDSFNNLRGIERCAVLFSGGVDSSLAAIMTARMCKDTLLITARCEGSHDSRIARKSAEAIAIPINEVTIDSEIVWKILPDIVKSIKSSKRMDVEIAIPFFLAAQEAHNQGYDILVSGQGPDELFAGYARYERLMNQKGTEAVEDALWADYSVTDDVNIQRDIGAITYHGLEAFFPYLHKGFVKTALSLPATMNIDSTKSPSRKLMFRKLAIALGVPEEVASIPKKATQYSSGTSKMLVKSFRQHSDLMRELSRSEIKNAIQQYLDNL